MERFLTLEDLGNLPAPKWLVEGLFEKEALVMLVGPPGAFKSFLAIDWALSLATHRPWNGRATEPSRVLYALGEGKSSLLKRVRAWEEYADLSKSERATLNANLRVTFDVPQLADRKNFSAFVTDLDADGFNPTVIIIDTLARSLVGKDENSQTDAGMWVEAADELRQRGAAVVVLHHTKKNTEFGLQYRGSSALQGAMDTTLILEKNPDGLRGFAKLSCSKQKDHEEPPDIWLKRVHIAPPDGTEGSIVLAEIDRPGKEQEEDLLAKEEEIDQMIAGLLADASFESDRARARKLAEHANLMEGTAQSRITRARRKLSAQ